MAAAVNSDRPHKVIIFSDSRGRNLAGHLTQVTSELNASFEVQTLPGATLDTILKKVERTTRRHTWDLCIILAGICNFTEKVTSRQHRYLQYKTRKVAEVKSTISNIIESQGTKVTICTITPAHLSKYSNHRKDIDNLQEEQDNLISDIDEANQHIIDLNISRDLPTINLARLSYTLSLKKQGPRNKRVTKFNPNELPDGVHPSTALEQRWANYITTQAEKIILKNLAKLNAEEDEDTEEENEDSWNFKRQKINM
jgi:lysophospholipase L1-like esterase